jgi:DNA mismatch endonuclease (patch repair protein)
MARIKSRDTGPEMLVRRRAHALGFRFRLCVKELPGKPDLVFPRHRLAIFVNGCFWHRHSGCCRCYTPKTRQEFWARKFSATVIRDQRNLHDLQQLGWRTAVIWECEAAQSASLDNRLREILVDRV